MFDSAVCCLTPRKPFKMSKRAKIDLSGSDGQRLSGLYPWNSYGQPKLETQRKDQAAVLGCSLSRIPSNTAM